MFRPGPPADGIWGTSSEKGDASQVSVPKDQATAPVSPVSASMLEQGIEPGVYLGSRYQLRALLGEGGMGAVFLAHDTALSSDVALKLLYHDVAHREDTLQRLRTEVLLAQKITHPNVCRTYDLEEIDGRFFVKMEFIAGETLAKRCRQEKQLAVPEVLRIARAIASGLAAAHAQDVVHCDLKPENILIEHRSHRVVLMDFGLARVEARSRVGCQDEISGTPAYMAPEQLASGHVDARTDLYSLGCVLHELLLGEVPHPLAKTFDSAKRYGQEPVPAPRIRRPEIPAWLSRIVERLLAKDPLKRYRSASELLDALGGPRRFLRSRTFISLVASAGLAATLAWYTASRQTSWQPQIQARSPAYEEDAGNAVISPNGESLAYVANREDEWRLYIEPLSGGPARSITIPGYLNSIRWTYDGRAILGVTQDDRVLRISVQGDGVEELARDTWAAEDCGGRLVLSTRDHTQASSDGQLLVQDRPGHMREILRVSGATEVILKELRCDRTGQRLVYTAINSKPGILSQSDIYLVNIDGGTPRQLTFDHQNNRSPVFAPDGRSVIFSSLRSGTSELWEIPVQEGEPALIPTGVGRVPFATSLPRASGADVSPDGKLLVYTEDTSALPLFAYRLDTDQHQRRRINATLDLLWQLHPTPDGTEVILRLTRGGKNYAAALSLQGKGERILTPADAVALTHDGREVIFAVNDRQGSEIRAMPRTGGPSRLITRLTGEVFSMVLDSDGWLYPRAAGMLNEGTWKVPLAGGPAIRASTLSDSLVEPAPVGGWRLVSHKLIGRTQRWHLLRPGDPLEAPGVRTFEARSRVAWAADGKSFVSWNGREVIRHDLATGATRVLLHSELLDAMALSHDGKTLFIGEWSGHATRQMIVNFADRRRPAH